MGAECSSEVKENPKPQPTPQSRQYRPDGGAVPSPVVSSFTSGSNVRPHRSYEDSLTTDKDGGEDNDSYETGCSGRHSLTGFVPTNKVMRWIRTLQPPSKAALVPEPDIWSDGEREVRDWIRTEGDRVDPACEKWDAPYYVSALGIRSASEQLSAKQLKERQRKAEAKARCR